ncbi:MAG TPA: tRNA (adenosine(37)-N6)-threonylcarbamoyltransferase complex ATPase subunit type 1 TsaE [Steroidobacteraceae bacterium]|nr:tRNA (adenosine(37)-N6)-threonylcarbamoyltransferase complex ATPase subunit type 1 TsaE [Steroidobacteraceae bacterium]
MRWRTATAEETAELGALLARARPEADARLAVLYLRGELGSGKTTFARGFARGAGVTAAVRSPTYTLLELYPAGRGTLVHLDLYRVQSAGELESLGLREWATPEHVWLIEWPERGGRRLPAADLEVTFVAGDAGHDIEIIGTSALGAAWLVELSGTASAGSS